MRCWIVILLLAVLPVQFSWAAVSACRGHDTDQQIQHLGHHEHQHAGQASADKDRDAASQDGQAANDVDGCGHCQGSCCSMPATVHSLSSHVITSASAASVAGIVRTLASSPPERPQWLRFV